MKNLLILLLLVPFVTNAQNSVNFDRYFTDQTLRIDYFHTGDAKSETFSLDKMYRQGQWAGNPFSLHSAI